MFEEQEIKVRVRTLNELSNVVLSFKEMGEDFKLEGHDHEYDLAVNHDKFTALLHLYKLDDYADSE